MTLALSQRELNLIHCLLEWSVYAYYYVHNALWKHGDDGIIGVGRDPLLFITVVGDDRRVI